ncbi:molybdate transport repressor ModE-like protein [Nonomuraea muscovyensis]|uniref:Molybdate transport repressor ModE-like protein n=1 Tax=Nonomuraea muscovyensis TaxID=1124761 RepID=A0A7X0EZ08_9ACTN|nr:LysR family transcriptional regulator [Nonomuraea muscovyensis]MBB6346325.1 molybdate transport repressor ModE-like protein [Nonomuraea muscovyensis]
MIDVKRLRILREVACHGSFSKAADALRFTPSAVSQQIAALERSIGAPVVERSTRGVVLTEPGRLLLDAAEAVFAELHHAKEQIDRLAAGRSRLTIATFSSGGRHILPRALTPFVAGHPEVEINVLEREPEAGLPLVRTGQADLAIAYHFDGPLPVTPGDRSRITWTPLMDDPMSVVLPRGHRLAGRPALDLADLAGERWVLGCTKTEAFLRRYAARAGFEPMFAGQTSDYFFAQSLVAAGVSVSLIPRVALDHAATGLAVVPIRPPCPTRHIGIATARRRHPQPLVDKLVHALLATVAEECRSTAV